MSPYKVAAKRPAAFKHIVPTTSPNAQARFCAQIVTKHAPAGA